jgi:hypothetical protein
MRKKLLISVWLLLPILALAFHYGPGQRRLAQDQVAAKIAAAQAAEKDGDWKTAVTAYSEAMSLLPAGQTAARNKLQLAHANARMFSGELPEAILELESLLTDMLKVGSAATETREVRGTLASAQYYAGWLMRLEGATPAEWTIQTEQARQNFRLLAEETRKEPTLALDYQKNLEATIRLERMDLSELQGLPLPKQCQGCKNCSQKCRSQRESKCKNPNESDQKKDARGAGVGKRPEGTGS